MQRLFTPRLFRPCVRHMAILNESHIITPSKPTGGRASRTLKQLKPVIDPKTKILRETGVIQTLEEDILEILDNDVEEELPRGDFTNILHENEIEMLRQAVARPPIQYTPPEPEETVINSPKGSKLVRVSLFGNPNVGKSTLVNRLLKQKASAVSSKAQTTRKRVLGVITQDKVQIVLNDTPGVLSDEQLSNISKRYKNDQEITELVEHAVGTIEESDIMLVMLDVTKPLDEIQHLLQKLSERIDEERKIELICVMNKSDMIEPPEKLYELREQLLERSEAQLFSQVFAISADRGSGVDDLVDYIKHRAVPGPWLYQPVEDSESLLPFMSARDRILEVVREKLFRRLNKEIPYQTRLTITDFDLREKGDNTELIVKITIDVNTPSQKGIVISSLKDVHRHSLTDLKRMYANVQVYLSFEVYSEQDVSRNRHQRKVKK